MFEIHEGSEAFTHLERVMLDPDTYKVSMASRPDLEQVTIKRNEDMWTPPLSTTYQPTLCNRVGPREASSACVLDPGHPGDHQDATDGTWLR